MSVFQQFRLEGRRALITGGSRGLGREMALAFAEAGADLVLVGRDRESLSQIKQELKVFDKEVHGIALDLKDGQSAEQLAAKVLGEIGPVDILVNNVGGRREDIPLEKMPLAIWQQYLEFNLSTAMICMSRFGAGMLERGWGRIINIASISGLVAMKGIQGRHYEAAKSAMVGLTRSMAVDWAARGVTVNAIAPGPFLTEPNRKWFRERPEFKKEMEAMIPMGRLGQPEEIAPLALYLASEASRFMTGAVLVLDGGMTAW